MRAMTVIVWLDSFLILFSEYQIKLYKLYPHLYFRIWLSIGSIWKFNSIQCVLKILLFIYPTGVYSFKAISRPINIAKITNDRNSTFRPRYPKFSFGRVGQRAIFSCQQHQSASLDVNSLCNCESTEYHLGSITQWYLQSDRRHFRVSKIISKLIIFMTFYRHGWSCEF